MKKILSLLSFILLISIFSINAGMVKFNGNFTEGNTLYSNWYDHINLTEGKDAYPVKICYTENICKSWNYHWEKQCVKYGTKTNRCIKYKRTKIIDNCKSYRNIIKCNPMDTPIGCLDQKTGTYTNQLKLSNFFYSRDGTNWSVVNYGETNFTKLYGNPVPVKFRVVIPNLCKPIYDINNSIMIE